MGEIDYFRTLDAALKDAGIAWPVMVVDRDRLDKNLDALAAIMPADKALRIVAKSLPSPALLRHVTGRLGTDRLMTFSVAMLRQLHEALPSMSHFFGKPVPAAAVASLAPQHRALLEDTVWLIDTMERLVQFEELASSKDLVLNVAIEFDVGLHRGGFGGQHDLHEALHKIDRSESLTFAGMLGYEPHIPSLPSFLGVRSRVEQEFAKQYRQAVSVAESVLGVERVRNSIRNTAGSKTLADRVKDDFVNDLSVGSLLLKPLNFDKVSRPAMKPAAFIATPLLKHADRFRIPGFGTSPFMRAVFEGGARSAVYIHGGHWLADPVHPSGLRYSKLVGRSSNQEILVSSAPIDAAVDDMVFLRPWQSEAILLQFGALVVVSDGKVVYSWDVFPTTA